MAFRSWRLEFGQELVFFNFLVLLCRLFVGRAYYLLGRARRILQILLSAIFLMTLFRGRIKVLQRLAIEALSSGHRRLMVRPEGRLAGVPAGRVCSLLLPAQVFQDMIEYLQTSRVLLRLLQLSL